MGSNTPFSSDSLSNKTICQTGDFSFKFIGPFVNWFASGTQTTANFHPCNYLSKKTSPLDLLIRTIILLKVTNSGRSFKKRVSLSQAYSSHRCNKGAITNGNRPVEFEPLTFSSEVWLNRYQLAHRGFYIYHTWYGIDAYVAFMKERALQTSNK